MKFQFLDPCVALVLLICLTEVWAQGNKGINPALLAKAKAGNADAEYRVSMSYSDLGNEKEANRWLLTAAQNGHVGAQFMLGAMYLYGSVLLPKDYAQAAVWLRKAAEQGFTDAQEELASIYNNGWGVPQDYSQAAIWWSKAAEQGDAYSQYNLGLAYYNGQGVPRQYAQAAFWFRRAAELRQGNSTEGPDWIRKTADKTTAGAQYMLGTLYAEGRGVEQNYVRAAEWYSKAANLGNEDAQRELGDLYDNGGVFKIIDAPGGSKRAVKDEGGGAFPENHVLAAIWYRKAAEQGDAIAQNNLGILYDNGQGVPQDYAEAYFWYSLAAAKQPGAFAENRDNAAAKLTKTVLSQTQERARKWFEDHPVQANSQ